MSEQIMIILTEKRVRLDMTLDAISRLPNSRGKSLAYTALQKGRMYVGELLRGLGKQYPYEATKTATTAEGIQEAVDKSEKHFALDKNEIINLNKLRDILEIETDIIVDKYLSFRANAPKMSSDKVRFIADCDFSEAYRSLKETRMWLGIRLGELRDNFKKAN